MLRAWALLDLLAQVDFSPCSRCCLAPVLQLLLPREALDPVAADAAGAARFHSRSFFWDGDILLAYALVGLVSWRMVREAHHVKSLFNTGVVLTLTGIAVLVLLGMISGTAANRSWAPDAANPQYEQYWKLHGGMEAVSNRADMLSDNLLALGAQYGWQLAGMMLMGAALMRSGWLKGSLAYVTTGVLARCWWRPAWRSICRQYSPSGIWPGTIAGARFYCRRRANLAPRCRLSAMPRWPGATGRSSAVSAWWALSPASDAWR